LRLIFLDFDGVLVTRKSWYVRSGNMATGDPDCVKALNRILEAAGADIVVSSTWRIGNSIAQLQEILSSWGVIGEVLDKTPRLIETCGSLYVARPRGDEIATFLENYQSVESFVILDDDADMGELLPRLVQTTFELGLTEADADKAIALLQEEV
jgi:phosphoglycolate phosphatase-like HAD superfamily hydrolase